MAASSHLPLAEAERHALAFLTDIEADQFRPYLESREWSAGAVVARENEAGDSVGFLVAGRLAVKKESGFPDKYIVLALLQPGAVVGEGLLVGQERYGVTIEALEASRLLVLRRQQMARLLVDHPALALILLQRLLYVSGLRLRRAGERLAQLL